MKDRTGDLSGDAKEPWPSLHWEFGIPQSVTYAASRPFPPPCPAPTSSSHPSHTCHLLTCAPPLPVSLSPPPSPSGTHVVIPTIPYGRTGAFAIALWFKREGPAAASPEPSGNATASDMLASSGPLYEYLFSHSNAGPDEDPSFRQNQVGRGAAVWSSGGRGQGMEGNKGLNTRDMWVPPLPCNRP